MSRLFISFSGGETSAFMTAWLMRHGQAYYNEIKILFANTGQEREETLLFVQQCADYFKWDVVWVEAVTHHGMRKASTHKEVDFNTASREGEPFEESIKKYGIPNQAFPQCTRELKLNPMLSYLKSVGWDKGTYDTAIGIRADEMDRVKWDKTKKANAPGIIYPLVPSRNWLCLPIEVTKPLINSFWRDMPFRLQLKGYEGNCAWCWKKTLRKHYTLIKENKKLYDFPARMESLYKNCGPQTGERVFFRQNTSTLELIKQAESAIFEPYHDDSIEYDPLLDVGAGCGESCEVFADGTLDDDTNEDT